MNYAKVLYKDGDKVRILKGRIMDEDATFLTVYCEHSIYRINKRSVLSVKAAIKQEKELEAKKYDKGNTIRTD